MRWIAQRARLVRGIELRAQWLIPFRAYGRRGALGYDLAVAPSPRRCWSSRTWSGNPSLPHDSIPRSARGGARGNYARRYTCNMLRLRTAIRALSAARHHRIPATRTPNALRLRRAPHLVWVAEGRRWVGFCHDAARGTAI